MLLLFLIGVIRCSFGSLCVSFVGICGFVCVFFTFGLEGGMWDLIELFLIIAFLLTSYDSSKIRFYGQFRH